MTEGAQNRVPRGQNTQGTMRHRKDLALTERWEVIKGLEPKGDREPVRSPTPACRGENVNPILGGSSGGNKEQLI